MSIKEKNTIEIQNTILLTDTDGIKFEININAVDGVLGICGAGAEVCVTGGERISVKETAVEVMEKIVQARFGINKSI